MHTSFIDFETTDKNVNSAEVLTGFVETYIGEKKIDELYIECRPEKWLEESFAIHGISRERASKFPMAKEGMASMLEYLEKYPSTVVCHARYAMFGSHGYFDWQIIRNWCYLDNKQDYFFHTFNNYKIESTHTMAKKAIHLPNYSLDNVAAHFGIELKHHDCRSDAEACRQIYFRLLNNKSSLLDFMEVGE